MWPHQICCIYVHTIVGNIGYHNVLFHTTAETVMTIVISSMTSNSSSGELSVEKVVVVGTWCMRCFWWFRPIVISYLYEYCTRVLVHLEGWAWVQKRGLSFRKSDDCAAHLVWLYRSPLFHLNLYWAVRKWRRLWPNSLVPQTQGGLDRLRTEHRWTASMLVTGRLELLVLGSCVFHEFAYFGNVRWFP